MSTVSNFKVLCENTRHYHFSGSVGTAALQIAKQLGAEVTAVCSSNNAPWIKKLGADHVLDYTTEVYRHDDKTYDVIFDTVGKFPWKQHLQRLLPSGILLLSAPGAMASLGIPLIQPFFRNKIIAGVASENTYCLNTLNDLVQGQKLKPVIDQVFRLSEMAKAHRYAEQGHKKGNVVIKISDSFF